MKQFTNRGVLLTAMKATLFTLALLTSVALTANAQPFNVINAPAAVDTIIGAAIGAATSHHAGRGAAIGGLIGLGVGEFAAANQQSYARTAPYYAVPAGVPVADTVILGAAIGAATSRHAGRGAAIGGLIGLGVGELAAANQQSYARTAPYYAAPAGVPVAYTVVGGPIYSDPSVCIIRSAEYSYPNTIVWGINWHGYHGRQVRSKGYAGYGPRGSYGGHNYAR